MCIRDREKILRKMPAGGEGMESTKVLELNPNHAVFGALKAAHEAGDTDKINKYAELLYDLSLIHILPPCWALKSSALAPARWLPWAA